MHESCPGERTHYHRVDHRPRRTLIALASLPLRPGSVGDDVADLQRRLRAAGFAPGDLAGEYTPQTSSAVAAFQVAAGLDSDGECDAHTWSALVEASFTLGARLLCLRSPMIRGDDVADLQLRLGSLGFDAGRVDAIFGSTTQSAVGEFQRNAGMVSDQVCGPETVASLRRLEGRGGSSPVTGVRERERLRRRARSATHLRIAIGSSGIAHPALHALASELRHGGAATVLLHGDWSQQAAATNDFDADVYLALVVSEEAMVEASYFSTPGYESDGGKRLAQLILRELPAAPGWAIGVAAGRRVPILRETRPPAVLLKLGDDGMLDLNQDLVIASLVRALDQWSIDPC